MDMQRSINELKAFWLLACLICVNLSAAQAPYWNYYRPQGYLDQRPYPLPRYTEQYRSPSISRPPVQNIIKTYEVQQYQNPWPQADYVPQQQNIQQTLPIEIVRAEESGQEFENVYYNPRRPTKSEDKLLYQGPADNATDPYWQDPKVIEKVHMLDEFLSEDSPSSDVDTNRIDSRGDISEETKRVVRQVRKQRPGFFWTLARITFEAFNETRSAIKQISDIIGNNIQPDPVTSASLVATTTTTTTRAPVTTTQGNNTSEATTTARTTTTAAPFVLTRGGIQTLIRRNVLGLVKLFNIEWRDALNQSEVSARQFRKELGNQVGTFLQDKPDNY